MQNFSFFQFLKIILLFIIIPVKAQFNFPDTIMVCSTSLVPIEMDLDASTLNLLSDIQNTTFSPLTLGDDFFSDTIDIGFNFTFYGHQYSHCLLSSNNFISFDTSYVSASSPYTISNALPDTTNNANAKKLRNTILAPWQDIQPNAGGLLDYATVGTSPNRVFVVRWFDVPMYQCVTSYFSSAILLYENGNKIETHIVDKPNCTWNNGLAIHGLQNKTGSIAEIVNDPSSGLDRNVPNTWNTTTEGVRFTPNGINDYTTDFIDFIPIISTANLLWSTTDNTLLGIGNSLDWNPNSTNNNIDTIIVSSPSFLSTVTDSIFLISNPLLKINLPNGTPCDLDSVILVHNLEYADSVLWSTGETTDSIQVTTNGIYTVTVFIDSCIYNRSISIFFDPADFELGNDTLLCYGDSILLGIPYFSATYTWQDGFHEPIYNVKDPGIYYVDMVLAGCLYTDTINISFTDYPIIPMDTMICNGAPFDLVINYPGSDILWNNGSTDSSITVDSTDFYTATITKGNCSWDAEIEVIFVDSLTYELGVDTAICIGDTLTLGTYLISADYLWHDGTTGSLFSVEETGTYYCEVTVGNCVISDTIHVTVDSVPVVDLGGGLLLCFGDTILLDAYIPGASYLWTAWDSTFTDSTLAVTQAGIYTVEVQRNGCFYWDTVRVQPVPTSLNIAPDTITLCEGDHYYLDAAGTSTNAIAFLWQDGSTTSTYFVTLPGTYHVEVFYGDCSVSDTVFIQTVPAPNIDLGPDIDICFGDTLWLDGTFPGATYSWQNGSTNALFGAHESGTYYVDVTLGTCLFTDTIHLNVKPISSFDLGPDQTICANDNLILSGFTPGATYLWNNGSTLSYQTVNIAGLYILEVNLDGCIKIDSIEVGIIPVPSFDLGPDTILCTGETIVLDAYFPGVTNYTWQDGSTSNTHYVNSSGIYSAIIELDGCTYKDQINVLIVDSINVELPDTVSFCYGESYQLNATYLDSGTTYSWNDGDTNALHTVTEAGLSYVTLSLGSCLLYDSTFVIVHQLPEVELLDTNICQGDQVIYNAYTPDAQNYLWQDGSVGSSIVASQEGWYTVTVYNEYCESKDSAYLSLTQEPSIFLSGDSFLCEDNSIVFNFTDTNFTYLWQNDSLTNFYEISEPGIYSLQVENKCGISESTITITREQCLCSLFTPNSFSPNGDGRNDSFEFFPECPLSLFELQIFDRWGKIVFQTDDYLELWNGTYEGELLAQESYVYKIKYSFIGEEIVHKNISTILLLL